MIKIIYINYVDSILLVYFFDDDKKQYMLEIIEI